MSLMHHQNSLPVFISFLFLQLFILHWGQLRGQDEENTHLQLADILKKTITVYGPDEVLENGRLYSPDHPRAKGNPFLTGPDWQEGKLTIRGDAYSGLKINYDVSLDQVILKKEIENQENHYPIMLNSNFIETFELEGHYFINLDDYTFNGEISGYAELIFQGNFIFLAKHKKEFLNQYSQSNPYGYYSKLNSTHYIYDKGKMTRLNSKGEFLDFFNPSRKELKKYFRHNNIRYKKASNVQFSELLKYADALSNN